MCQCSPSPNLILICFLLYAQLTRHADKRVADDQLVDENEIDTNHNLDSFPTSGISKTYRPQQLKFWRAAPLVSDVYGRPGEMGKPVKIPAEKHALMKEKFKENQFNLMASDMISLNRSLVDVRHDK